MLLKENKLLCFTLALMQPKACLRDPPPLLPVLSLMKCSLGVPVELPSKKQYLSTMISQGKHHWLQLSGTLHSLEADLKVSNH